MTVAAGYPLAVLYHFCRLQLPTITLSERHFERHLERTYQLFVAKGQPEPLSLPGYVDRLHLLDWYLACACLERDGQAWELLFAARAGRSDCLLIDALRARAARLYPRDEERQESAVSEFWSRLLVAERAESLPILARFDGQRPLVPWLIRVFQNWHISVLRQPAAVHVLADDELVGSEAAAGDARWHDAFRTAAHEVFHDLTDNDVLILGLRLRYRLSQREVAGQLGVHEGTVSRQTTSLRDRCLKGISERLLAEGWTGDDLSAFVLTEMESLLLDEPRLSADHLAGLLAARGRSLPDTGG